MRSVQPVLRSSALPALLLACFACGGAPSSPPQAPSEPEHHHELHLPPVGPEVHVTLDGKSADVNLGALPNPEGTTVGLAAVWKAAFPSEDPAALHFDLTGSDGFHPASRSKCVRLLTGAEIVAARIDAATHDVSYDAALRLPGCYRVKAVVRIDATR